RSRSRASPGVTASPARAIAPASQRAVLRRNYATRASFIHADGRLRDEREGGEYMRKAALIAVGAFIALATAAVAMAAVFTASGISTTTATLNTTQATDVRTRTCTGGDNKTFTVTDARYTGAADFTNPGSEFDGPLTIRARTVVDTATKLGVVQGSFKVNDSD